MKRQFHCSRNGFVLAMGVTGTSLIFATAAMAGDVSATFTLNVNDEPSIVVADEFVDQSGGFYHFVGEYVDPDNRWTIKWNYWVDPNPLEGDAAILGMAEVLNTSGEEGDFRIMVDVPLCPAIEGPSLLGAFVVVRINTNEEGGMMTDLNQESVWAVMADGEEARTVFDSPFLLGSSGQGNASLTSSFGAPFPAELGLPIHESAGLRHQFSMTDGDTAKITTSLYIGSETGHFTACSDNDYPNGDVNQDGNVDALDLLILLSSWGYCPGCDADLDGDGWVGGNDLMIVLSNWD